MEKKSPSKSDNSQNKNINFLCSLEDHEEKKRKKITLLKQKATEDQKIIHSLGSKTRKEQVEKGKNLARTSPLAEDEYKVYQERMAKINPKYKSK